MFRLEGEVDQDDAAEVTVTQYIWRFLIKWDPDMRFAIKAHTDALEQTGFPQKSP